MVVPFTRDRMYGRTFFSSAALVSAVFCLSFTSFATVCETALLNFFDSVKSALLLLILVLILVLFPPDGDRMRLLPSVSSLFRCRRSSSLCSLDNFMYSALVWKRSATPVEPVPTLELAEDAVAADGMSYACDLFCVVILFTTGSWGSKNDAVSSKLLIFPRGPVSFRHSAIAACKGASLFSIASSKYVTRDSSFGS